jgi:predicted PurR-regulated permease PerM
VGKINTTVKAILMIIVLIVIISGFAGYTINYLCSSSEQLEDRINTIENNIKANEWLDALQNLDSVALEWDKISNLWSMLIDHSEIDNITESLSRIQAYINENSTVLSLAELNVLKNYLKHIPEKESLKLKNLF